MSKKYKLLEESIQYDGIKLCRIEALKSFSDVNKGDLGGWVEKEKNLSQEDTCWVYDNAKVCEDAEVSGSASIRDNVILRGSCKVRSTAKVSQDVEVFGACTITSHTNVKGSYVLDIPLYIWNVDISDVREELVVFSLVIEGYNLAWHIKDKVWLLERENMTHSELRDYIKDEYKEYTDQVDDYIMMVEEEY